MDERDLVERRTSGTTVFEGRLVRLEVDRVRLADGAESVREVVRHSGAVVMLPVDDAQRVLMVRQFRYPTGETLLELPAGTLEPGEAPEACAARELAEEVGHRAGRLEKVGELYSAPGFCDELLHAFVATELQPVQGVGADEDERLVVERVALADLFGAVREGRVRDAKTAALVGIYHMTTGR